MAPRKSTKSPESQDQPSPEKPAAKPRTLKTAPAGPAPAQAPPVAAEPPAPAKRGRKAKTPAPPVPEPLVPAVSAPAAPGELPEQVWAVLAAIREGRAVEFIFSDAETNPPRTFEPRQLIFDVFAQGWYAWGWDRRYNAERHHRVDLLAEVNSVEGVGRAAQGPYKDGTPANQIGGWLGGEPIPVKAVLLKQWIYAVKQAPAPFPDFHMEDLEEGKAQVSFVGTDLRAIARWCMQFGDGIQVLEPQRLLDRIKQVGMAWAGKSAQLPPPPAPAKAPEPKRDPAPRRAEHPRREAKEPHESREPKEAEAPRSKPAKVEIRIDRL